MDSESYHGIACSLSSMGKAGVQTKCRVSETGSRRNSILCKPSYLFRVEIVLESTRGYSGK